MAFYPPRVSNNSGTDRSANAGFDAIQHRFGNFFAAMDVMPRDLCDGAVHRQVILAGRDQQIDLLDQAVSSTS